MKIDYPDSIKSMMIRQARKKLRMKQLDFAELIGSSAATVCQWEMERRIPRGPTWRMILILCESKGITFDDKGILIDSTKLDKKKKKVA